jgi:hypothetical protein
MINCFFTLFYFSRLDQKDSKENQEDKDSQMGLMVCWKTGKKSFEIISYIYYNVGDRGDAGLPGDKGFPGIGFNITGPPG